MNRNIFLNQIKNYLELSKLKIMFPVSLTGFTGFFLFDPHVSLQIMLVSTGVLFLGISASVLNQIQEKDLDYRMHRTHNRPLPAKLIKVPHAFLFFSLMLTAGTILVYSFGNIISAIIGLFTIIWYNGIYTYAKRKTAFAVVPGAITGALPPLIGWVAAGGGVWDTPVIFLEFLFFTGQIPHFWLLVLKYGEEYEKAGMPSLTSIMSRPQINRLTFTWVVTSVMAALFLSYFGIIHNVFIIGILLISSVYLIWQFSGLLKPASDNIKLRFYSILLYSYYLLLIILLITDRILLLHSVINKSML
ncbi:MAG: protoheme IX farnesyltransferase [Bacteroidia bacterium]|nr:protoheme IX farnesyltransferase [Bacteroidia bacterium]